MSFRLELRAALRADGRIVAPALWRVDGGRTRALDPLPRPGPGLVDAVLVPGLVNAHAHLDLAGAPPLPAAGAFTDWLLAVGGVRGDARDVEAAARAQAQALARRGVTAIGDIDASAGRATAGRRQAGLGGLSYLEIVGVQRDAARARLAQSLALVDRLGGGARCTGLSPHAPYSVNADVLPEIARAARLRGLRLAMHLAETADETRYLLHGDGPFVDFLRTIGRGEPFAAPPRLRPIALAEQSGLLAAGCVVIHGNDLDDDDIARLAAQRSSVVYCHGTHAHFARPRHRLPELLAAGVNVAFGTDSGLSNVRVDLLDELRLLHADRPELDPLELVRCATWGGRVALQHEPAAALLQPGSAADALLLAAPPDAERRSARELADWTLSDDAQPLLTFHAGRSVAARDEMPPSLLAFLDTTRGHG